MLTKRRAIRECKKLWKEIEKSGLSKDKFLSTKAGNIWRNKKYSHNCPLCQYWEEKFIPPAKSESACDGICPLFLQYGKSCVDLDWADDLIPSQKWLDAIKGLKE